MKRPKPTQPITPFMLGAIYRKTDAQDLLGIGQHLMRSLHRKGKVELRRMGNKDYLRSDDLWEAMEPVKVSSRTSQA